MISKEYIDNFKEKIKYNEVSDLFKENTDDNFFTFDEKMANCTLNDLEEIIFSEIKVFGELDEKDTEHKVKYIKDSKNIIIIFSNESKLLIIPHENGFKYHAIPAPVKSTRKKPIRRSSTILISNNKKKRII